MDFLDLTDATDTEKRRLQDLLFNNKCSGVQLPFEIATKKPFAAKAVLTEVTDSDSNITEKGIPDDEQTAASLSSQNGHPAHHRTVRRSSPPSSIAIENQQPFAAPALPVAVSPFASVQSFDQSAASGSKDCDSPPHGLSPNQSSAVPSLMPYQMVTHVPVMSSMGQMLRASAPGVDVRSGSSAGAPSPTHLVTNATGLPFPFIGPNGAPAAAFIPGQPMAPVPGGQHSAAAAAGGPYVGPNGPQQQMFPPPAFIPYPYFFVPQQAYPGPHLQPHDQRAAHQLLEESMAQRDMHLHMQQQQSHHVFADNRMEMGGNRSGGSNQSHGSGSRRRHNIRNRKQSVPSGESSPHTHPHQHHNHRHPHHQQQQYQPSYHRQAESVPHSPHDAVTPSNAGQVSDSSHQTRCSSTTSSSSHIVQPSPPTSLSSCPCFSDEELAVASVTTTITTSSTSGSTQPEEQHLTRAQQEKTLQPRHQQQESSATVASDSHPISSPPAVPATATTATPPVTSVHPMSEAKKATPKKRNSPLASKITSVPQSNGHSAATAPAAPVSGKPPSGPKSWSSLFKSAQSASSVAVPTAGLHTSKSTASSTTKSSQMFDRVCLGGTFDSIHDGHRKLLNESLSKCSEVLTIGVTDESMIMKKKLWELIRPVEQRIDDVRNHCESFLKSEGRSAVKLNIVPISDPFGPAITDSSLKAIVVSDETIAGGTKINEIRKEKGMPLLEVISIRLIPTDHKESSLEEDKVSSSTLRIRKLGTLIKEPLTNSRLPKRPYLIGLTGGIASGKTSIATEFKRLGAGVIDCDKMAHLTYQPGSSAYEKIVREFGQEVVDHRTNEIIRKKLGAKVFGNDAAKAKLESIVWPETSKLVFQEAERLRSQEKKEVVIFEAAQLIEAKWTERMHQVWVSIIPEDVAIKRVMERNALSENEARLRVKSQMPNRERVSRANVVFSTLWDRDFTRSQVQKAWNMLNKRFLRAV